MYLSIGGWMEGVNRILLPLVFFLLLSTGERCRKLSMPLFNQGNIAQRRGNRVPSRTHKNFPEYPTESQTVVIDRVDDFLSQRDEERENENSRFS